MSLNSLFNSISLDAIAKRIAHHDKNISKKLWIARINKKSSDYIKEKLRSALFAASAIAILTFFLVDKMGESYIFIPIVFAVCGFMFYNMLIRQVDSEVSKRAKNIDKEVLFAGRFLLVKLNSGKPLINALIEASESYGVANQYFKSIVHEISSGTPLEESLEKAVKYCPSDKMKRILFQINNSLRIGMDVTESLDATLDQITNEQLVEIQKYGKKLSSVTMFYMLGAVVMPSLGLTIFVIIASMINIQADFTLFALIAVVLVIIEFVFLAVFKSIRPNVNI